MMVAPVIPQLVEMSRAREKAQQSASTIYGRPVSVQLVWITRENFNRMRRSVNHLVARAAREGITMPRNPEDYYSADEDWQNDHSQEWYVTDERLRQVGNCMRDLEILHNHGGTDEGHGKNAQEAMEHALKAVISAAGVRYGTTHHIGDLIN